MGGSVAGWFKALDLRKQLDSRWAKVRASSNLAATKGFVIQSHNEVKQQQQQQLKTNCNVVDPWEWLPCESKKCCVLGVGRD